MNDLLKHLAAREYERQSLFERMLADVCKAEPEITVGTRLGLADVAYCQFCNSCGHVVDGKASPNMKHEPECLHIAALAYKEKYGEF